ncbi:MAG: hypothetical protein COB61_000755 [Thiotrichales bacterium]|nr:hypothetical protein [Thiotrichales bacterium]
MLNELYSIYRGLEAVGESPEIKHNDIQSPGMGVTFRVMLDESGQVTSVKLMSKEQIQDSWSLGNGNKNQFPVIKVVYPLLAEGHKDYLLWKEKTSKPTEAEYREFIERISEQYAVDLSHIKLWPSYRKQVLERKDQLAGIDDCEAVNQLFERYSQTETGVEILEQVASLLIEYSLQGADTYSLKHICTLLFGDDVTPKGVVKDGKRVTLILDCFPQTDIDIYASSRRQVAGLSRALFTAESKAHKKTRSDECALTGNVGPVVYDIFPKEKLSVVGGTTLFSKNATTSGPTVKRYDVSGGVAFSVSDKLSQELAASIAFINLEKFKNKIWSKLPSTLGASPSLLLAYCKEDWDISLTPLITGESDIEGFEDYLDATESVIASFKGKDLGLDVAVDFTEIIVLDKANRKINFSTTTNIDELIRAAEQWKQACQNFPCLKLYVRVRKNEKKMSSPWAISPQQIMYLSRQKYIRDGTASTSLPGISFSDVMKLFIGKNNQALAKRCLQRIAEQYQPLLNYSALSQLQSVLKAKAHVKTNPKNNTQTLSAVTLMSLLLYKTERTKEIYMKDFAFQLGQLCSAMDELHIGYCKSERKGDIPSTLIGNQVYGMALQSPVKAMSFMAARRRPYDAWVKRMMAKNDRSEDKAITGAIFAQIWMSKQAKSLNEFLSSPMTKTDTYKAELMLGYLAGRPFEQKNTSNNNQGEKS